MSLVCSLSPELHMSREDGWQGVGSEVEQGCFGMGMLIEDQPPWIDGTGQARMHQRPKHRLIIWLTSFFTPALAIVAIN